MDTQLINEPGTEILSYRIRTARQKIRMQYKDFDKRLIALSKEESILRNNKYKPEWEPLVPPVQRGWKRFFVLRDDVARSKHAQFFENILRKINTQQVYWRKDFKVKKRKFGRKIYIVKPQELQRLSMYEFNKLNFSNEEKSFFHIEQHYERWQRKFVSRFVFNEPWRFVLRIKPNMIDKQRKIDAEKEQRLKEIENYFERNNYRARLNKVWYRHQHKNWHRKRPDKYLFRNKSLQEVIDCIREEVI